MPFFSRRRLQNMLDELRPLLRSNSKVKGLLGDLKNKKPGQALGAEMELALLWGIKQVATIEVEPELSNNRTPDAFSENLFESPAYIDVTTVSDGMLSGEENMQRATQQIVSYVNSVKNKLGNFLYFTFHENTYLKKGNFYQELRIAQDFELTNSLKQLIDDWLNSNELGELYLQNEKIEVTIQKKKHKQRQGSNFFSSIPPLAYDIKKNPLVNCLKSKQDQLSAVPAGKLKVVFLADAGNTILKNIRENNIRGWHFTGEEIIKNFLKRSSIDVVYVFTPKRIRNTFGDDILEWQVSYYINENYGKPTTIFNKVLRRLSILKKDITHCADKIKTMVQYLPKPMFEGYQARSLQQQGAFSPKNNKWYNGTLITSNEDRLTMKISSRALHEYLAGNDTHDTFLNNISSNKDNFFKLWLDKGYVIKEISFEDGGVDEDDDHVVFNFEKDPSISPLK